jgi:hypothetical protein
MAKEPQYLGVTEFVEQLSAEFSSLSLKAQDESQLNAKVAEVVKRFAEEKLAPLNLPYCMRRHDEGLQPVSIFGIDFYPELMIEVSKFPTVAFVLKLAKGEEELRNKISSAIGQGLIYRQYYPAVIAFVWNEKRGEVHKHWFDWEFKADLWKRHKIKLIIRG